MDRLRMAADTSQHLVSTMTGFAADLKNSNRSFALVAAGKINEIANYFASAKECYSEAYNLERGNNEALARLSISQLKLGLATEALANAGALVERSPQFRFLTLDGKPTSGLAILGDAHRASGNYQRAARAYEQAIALVPDDGYSVGRAAEQYVRAGNLGAAHALESRIPDHDLFSTVRSILRLTQNDPEKLPSILGFREGIQLMSHV